VWDTFSADGPREVVACLRGAGRGSVVVLLLPSIPHPPNKDRVAKSSNYWYLQLKQACSILNITIA